MIAFYDCTKAMNYPDRSSRGGKTEDVREAVAAILADVRQNGDEALLRYARQFDGPVDALEITTEEIDAAFARTDPAFIAILNRAAANITDFHARQKRGGFLVDDKPGVVLGQRIVPLDRVGIYIPGGTATYPSSVLMNAIPAKLAGVGEVVMVTPAKNGTIRDDILAAAKVAGVDRIFRVGGAQAVAALSYGTQSVPRVDKIVGPGNVYVATAKQMVYGLVDIDMIAGPSEILVIADETANPVHIAADLLSQAEHDVLSSVTLITTSRAVAEATAAELESQLQTLPREAIARQSIEDFGAVILVNTLDEAAAVSNDIAPEHLELCVDSPFGLLPKIRHAGSIFLGKYAPEALGDYLAGPNHTLPTNGAARFSSPLSVDDFVKKSSFIYYEQDALRQAAADIAAFARREGLEAHARSIESRFQ